MRRVDALWPLPVAVMVASTLVWAAHHVDGRNVAAAQMELLRAEASTHPSIALDSSSTGARLPEVSLPQRMRLEFERSTTDGAAGRNASLFDLPGYRRASIASPPSLTRHADG